MHDLEITWPEGQARFSPDDSPVEIGRSPDAAIVMTEPSVSRRHIEFIWTGSAWTAADSSTHGSFDPIGVRLAPTWTVGTNTTIRLGGVEGVEVRIELQTVQPEAAEPAMGGIAPPLDAAEPPGPPGLNDPPLDQAAPPPAAAGQASAAFDHPIIGDQAPSAVDAAPSTPGSGEAPSLFDAPPPGHTPSVFDPPPQSEPAPAPFEPPPQSEPAPSAFDPPAAQQPPSAFEAPPPQQPAPAFDPPGPQQAPSAFDAPPPQQAAPAFDPPAFDAGPQPGFDPPPSAGSPPAGPPSTGSPGAGPPGAGLPGDSGQLDPNVTGIIGDPAATSAYAEAILQLSIDGRDFTFVPGTEVTVGRDPSCLVAVDERHSLVSRRHLKITHRDGAWWIEDFSSKGTFVDGRELTGPYRAEGAFMAQLGDDDAGTPLRIHTAGEHKAPRGQNLALIAAIIAVALVAIIAVFLVLGGGDDGGETETGAPATTGAGTGSDGSTAPLADLSDTAASDLSAAKQATVLLLADEGLGSGFFVSDSLIVTNQHVAALAPSLLVGVSRTTDDPAMFEYEASTVAVHPYLDIAVLELTNDIETGDPADSSGLDAAVIGDSTSLVLGDDVYSTGFPANFSVITADDMGDVRLPAVGTTSGEAANFAIWPGCSNPTSDSFIPEGSPAGVGCAPEGDVDRGIVITTFASGQGASGSPVFRGGEVVAVVFAGPLDEANAGHNITTASFAPWLNDVIANSG